MSNQERKQGTIVLFKQDKGFGVIRVGGPESLERFFLHTKYIRSGTAIPKPGQTVFFDISPERPRKEGQLPLAIRVDVVVEAKPTTEAL